MGISSEGERDEKYKSFLEKAIAKFEGGILNKQISERFKRRCEYEFNSAINGLKTFEDVSKLKANHVEELDPEKWNLKPETIFNEEKIFS